MKREATERSHYLAMDFITLFFLFSAIFTASAQQIQSNVSRSSSLTPTTNSTWLSRSGLYAFGFYKQGNGYAVGIFMAGIPEKTVVWTANRDDPPVSSNATLLFASDGRLVLQMGQEQVAVVAESSGSASASMLNSGNFVIYNSDQGIIWQSFDHPTDTLLPGQRLLAGHEIVSSTSETQYSTGIFRLKMQTDGNLVQYPVNTPDTAPYAYFATSAGGLGDNVTLNFDADGHLYLLNATGFNIRNLTDGGYPTKETIYRTTIDVDGIFRLYSHNLKQNGNWSIVWLPSSDLCAPKGLCGLNGFCVLNDRKASCACLPGFEMVQQGNWTAGCERNFTVESCKSNDGDIKYNMQEVANTIWEDASYSALTVPFKGSCAQACLEDCNCEAVLFKDRTCQKQRLPLRYGRRQLTDSTIAFIKVSTSTPTPTTPNGNILKENKKELRVSILIISASVGALGCMMLVISGIVFYKNHFRYKKLSCEGNVELSDDFAPRSFTYSELEKVTDGFREEIGRGAFGSVFKGALWNGQKVVAVKRLEKVLAEGEREFQTEMKLLKPDQTKTFTVGIRGTKGYVAPEWHRKLPITVKADVYSYGIMLFEIICCRKSVDWNLPEEESVLDEWVCDCFQSGNLTKLVGNEEADKKQVERMVKLGLWCIQDDPSLRPSMKKVLLMLEGTVDIPIPPKPDSFLSTI
ncbi:hypothetical protein FH972_002850 [Carpinus fangiana]|uniref:Bulb-type lectin domain-containing protein n=1 Tax=Carpinus fangiana TaxID=176857 RepID=A0A5N6QII8_9ROSI|nr:hypothetical protein FH972_002850 [Carpinus fangiana]